MGLLKSQLKLQLWGTAETAPPLAPHASYRNWELTLKPNDIFLRMTSLVCSKKFSCGVGRHRDLRAGHKQNTVLCQVPIYKAETWSFTLSGQVWTKGFPYATMRGYSLWLNAVISHIFIVKEICICSLTTRVCQLLWTLPDMLTWWERGAPVQKYCWRADTSFTHRRIMYVSG